MRFILIFSCFLIGACARTSELTIAKHFAVKNGECRVAGKILDSETGKPIYFAQVVAMGAGRGAFTDSSGIYEFDSLPRGHYVFWAKSTGYIDCRSQKIALHEGELVVIDFKLVPGENEMVIW
jgi:ribosomal protein L27